MISKDDILQEVYTLANTEDMEKDSAFVLSSLLKQVESVDYRAETHSKEINQLVERKEKAIKDGDNDTMVKIQKEIEGLKLYHKHYLVITIEKLLELARSNEWDLCKRFIYYYVFNGQYWTVIDEDDLISFLGKVAEGMGVPKFDSRHYDFKNKLFKQFESAAHLPEPKIPDDTVLINLQNGTFEISSSGQKLREFQRDDFLTYQLPFDYDSEATAPIFERYLNEVLPDQESQLVLAEFMGYIFTRNLKLEKVLFLYGSGRNGKSVLFEIIRAMLGEENISFYGLANVTHENGYYRAKLVNKLINWASDIGDKLQSNTFKQLASGEPIECRLPHRDPFILRNVCKFAFNTNKLPVDVEHTRAFFERFLIIPFDQYIPEERQDKELSKKIIRNELPGVFNWVLDGLNRLIDQGRFSRCKASEKALAEFKKDSDSVAMFIDEMNYQPDSEQYKSAKYVYDDYKSYCIEEGLKPLARKNFHKRLEALGFWIVKKSIGLVIHLKVDKYTDTEKAQEGEFFDDSDLNAHKEFAP